MRSPGMKDELFALEAHKAETAAAKLRHELLHQLRPHQVGPEPAQHARLEHIAPNHQPVVADTTVARVRAPILRSANH